MTDAVHPQSGSAGRVVGILQPGYLPWLGFFEQMNRADVFVLYDDVAYDKNGWRNRNRIKTVNGAQWLTVPVHVSHSQQTLIRDVKIDNGQNWRKKHLASIEQAYSKAPYFSSYIDRFREVYAREWDRLADLDECLIRLIADSLGIDKKPLIRSSALAATGDRIDRLVAICKECGARTFYEGAAGRSYIDPEYFEERGIAVVFQDYIHPEYSQLHGSFVPLMSTIDILFTHGEGSLAILAGPGTQGAP